MHSFSHYLLNISYVPGTFLSIGSSAVTKQMYNLAFLAYMERI